MTPRPQRTSSTYEAECVCGAKVESQTRVATCPACQRRLVFEWGRTAIVCVDRFPEEVQK